jgi:hypothetical protein
MGHIAFVESKSNILHLRGHSNIDNNAVALFSAAHDEGRVTLAWANVDYDLQVLVKILTRVHWRCDISCRRCGSIQSVTS